MITNYFSVFFRDFLGGFPLGEEQYKLFHLHVLNGMGTGSGKKVVGKK